MTVLVRPTGRLYRPLTQLVRRRQARALYERVSNFWGAHPTHGAAYPDLAVAVRSQIESVRAWLRGL